MITCKCKKKYQVFLPKFCNDCGRLLVKCYNCKFKDSSHCNSCKNFDSFEIYNYFFYSFMWLNNIKTRCKLMIFLTIPLTLLLLTHFYLPNEKSTIILILYLVNSFAMMTLGLLMIFVNFIVSNINIDFLTRSTIIDIKIDKGYLYGHNNN